MSAIFGATFPLDAATKSAMVARLAHRAGSVEQSQAASGSIEIVSAGDKSVVTDGSISVAADGVFLGRRGDSPDGPANDSLTAAVASTYLESGLSALMTIDGEFAAAILDRRQDRLFLTRGRVGSRPLYYARMERGYAFASEYKALLVLQDLPRQVDFNALEEIHRFKSVPRGRTLFSSIEQVLPGSVVELKEGSARVHECWKPSLAIDESISLQAGSATLADMLVESIARRAGLADGAGIGLALSGGVDSMVLLGAASRAGIGVKTFSIGDSETDPEIEWARRIADHFSTEHKDTVLDSSRLLEDLPALVWALEDPIARTETLLTMQLCDLASGETGYMIRGDGADGLFGGMGRHKLLALGGSYGILAHDAWQLYDYTQTGTAPTRVLARLVAATLLRSHVPPFPMDISALSGYTLEQPNPLDRELLNRVLISGPAHSLPTLLQKAEGPSRLGGVVPTTPFTDRSIMQFAFQVPSRLKNNGRGNKIVLRNAARKLIPEQFANRPKYPQRVRETSSFCEALADVANRLDLRSALPARAQFAGDRLEELLKIKTNVPWSPEHAMRVWTLVLSEIWFRTFVDNDGSKPITV